jgi:hypothetical protein
MDYGEGASNSHRMPQSPRFKKRKLQKGDLRIVFYSFYEICFLFTVLAAQPQEASFTFETCIELCIKFWKFIDILLVRLLIYFLLPFVNNILWCWNTHPVQIYEYSIQTILIS